MIYNYIRQEATRAPIVELTGEIERRD